MTEDEQKALIIQAMKKQLDPIILQACEDSFNDAISCVVKILTDVEASELPLSVKEIRELVQLMEWKSFSDGTAFNYSPVRNIHDNRDSV